MKEPEKEKEKHFHVELYTIRIHATFDQKKKATLNFERVRGLNFVVLHD